ncbi:MAG: VIT domain-containing protein [Bacillota bacterium]
MKTRSVISLLAFLFLFPIINLFAVNDLVIKLPNSYSSVKGYIDKATLVLEPHGGYSEQSLYLNYSDHHQFSSSQQVEIIHRFELPQGAVVNDMWLWIGDSVMQAKVLDTWTARHIYDSITTTKRDPAYLYKIGNQYELRIFPLISGGYRRVKINFIVPTKWNGNTAVIEFPVAMLNSNNNSQKPLEVLFRTKQNIWGNPVIAEAPGQEFVNKADTLGFNYMFTLIQSTSQFSSLNLNYKLDISDGAFFSSTEGKDNLTYIQSVFSLKDAFGLKTDSSARKNLIALDLSGNFNKNFSELIPRLKSLLSNSLKPNDLFNIIVSGAGRTVKLFNQWKTADLQTINNSLNEFNSSSFGDSVSKVKLPRLVFADAGAYNNLGYNEIRNISDLRQFSFLADSYKYFSQADVVSYYNDLPGSSTMSLVYQSIDSLLARGGRFYSRAGFPQYPPQHYIPDMKEACNSHGLVKNLTEPKRNIVAYLPEKI